MLQAHKPSQSSYRFALKEQHGFKLLNQEGGLQLSSAWLPALSTIKSYQHSETVHEKSSELVRGRSSTGRERRQN